MCWCFVFVYVLKCLDDFVSCCVVFDTSCDMLTALKGFVTHVENGNKENGFVEIVQVKNEFSRALQWTKMADCSYCEIKVMVVIYEDGEAMIGTIKFLLKWMVDAREIGKKLYSNYKKQMKWVQHLEAFSIGHDNSYDKYKEKLSLLIDNNNESRLAQELIWKPNIILSMICKGDRNGSKRNVPLLFNTGKHDGIFDTFYGCLIHYGKNILGINNKNDIKTGGELVRNYLNYSLTKNTIFEHLFWGINTIELENGCLFLDKIELIMKNEYFHGIHASNGDTDDNIIQTCCQLNCYEYLCLILKYFDKNEMFISNCLQWDKTVSSEHWLMELLRLPHCNEQWLQLLLFATDGSHLHSHSHLHLHSHSHLLNQSKILDGKVLESAMLYCTKENKPKEWVDIFDKYLKQTNQHA